MRIYKIAAVTPEQNKKRIDDLESDLKSMKKDLKGLDSDIKKVAKSIEDLNIGERRFWQQHTSFTSVERKLERFEKLENEWKQFKDELKDDIRKELEKRQRASIGGGNPQR